MKNTATCTWMATATALAAVGVFCAPPALADDTSVHTFGTSAQLINGDVAQAWTVSDLRPSTDAIPYHAVGTLWEATASDVAVRGAVTPIVSNFNARSVSSGQTYRVLFGVATPQGVNPATLAQGATTTGKLYFDVTGEAPDTVVYNAGGPDLAAWVSAPPAPAVSAAGAGSASRASSAPTAATPTPSGGSATALAPAPAGAQVTPLPAANAQVTPAPGASTGTPLPAGTSQGTPITGSTPASPTAPATAAAEQPAPASQGTPALTTNQPPSTSVTPAPAAAGQPAAQASQGTPVGSVPVSPAPTTTAAPTAG